MPMSMPMLMHMPMLVVQQCSTQRVNYKYIYKYNASISSITSPIQRLQHNDCIPQSQLPFIVGRSASRPSLVPA